ncbi:MAG: exodeoxyribonuclease VII small subunit [Lewinellaceae bacterium]|jgi:exodeoxyribonuclease VII small subunit|nr:exodeoxyribonuclease VII small subunit [Lewinellaceae bacterium]
MKKQEEILSYESAQQELQQIVQDLQSEAVRIDELGEKIARANALIQFCRERLRTTEEEVAKLSK